MKLTFYNLIFKSHTTPTKFMMGMTSILWPIVEYTMNHNTSIFFGLMFLYGAGMLWRTIDYMHRATSSLIISLLGAALWSYVAWMNILNLDTSSSSILLPVMYAAAALWLLVRCGSGEIINVPKTTSKDSA